ncbi:MAG: RsmE family RNA methyltransferase [Clostridia bacterium]|nr:RsmE family RNA methyltransferase [Clostridia bacterium]
MARFFVSPGDICGNTIQITGDDAAHIARVLRMRVGEMLTVCDGNLTDYLCSISAIHKDCVTVSVQEKMQNMCEPPVQITLYQGMPKGAKMDYIVQKCVEVGVCRIVPMQTEFVVSKGEVKEERLNRIALEAAKQSGRGTVPLVTKTMPFDQAVIAAAKAELAVFPYECEKRNSLKAILRGKMPKTVSIMIGPEGGFSANEVEQAKSCGLHVVTLGGRILRTETAGLVAAGNVLYELESEA